MENTGSPDAVLDPLSDAGERQAIFAVLDSFRQYRRQTHFTSTHRRRQNFYALPRKHQELLNKPPIELLNILSQIDDAIDDNADLADAILEQALESFDLPAEPDRGSLLDWHGAAKEEDLNKAHATVRQFYRDWSQEGFTLEVKPILQIILQDLQDTSRDVNGTRILLPGAGLGRLLFELCLAGYHAEGNEISYHQLFASNFVLNHCKNAGQFKLYPFVTTFTNRLSRRDQLRLVTVPDIHPGDTMLERMNSTSNGEDSFELVPGSMGMSAGDFISSYGSTNAAEAFGVVATVYFVDTAPNLIRYIETIQNCLKPGGIWINIGPLLWHFEDRMTKRNGDGDHEHSDELSTTNTAPNDGIAEPGSFEVTNEEVLSLVQNMGFEILKQEILETVQGYYVQDPSSMLQSLYRSSHFVARKKIIYP